MNVCGDFRGSLARTSALLATIGLAAFCAIFAVGVHPAWAQPGPDTAVVTVSVGGDRLPDGSIAALDGVVLGLYAPGAPASDPNAATTLVTTCTSTGGVCSFDVTGTGPGGPNEGVQFWVKQISAPAGWNVNTTLRTGATDGTNSIATPYAFQTPPLYAANTYESGSSAGSFMNQGDTANTSTSAANRRASVGVWQQSRVNPPLPPQCGLRVALIMDLSSSVAGLEPALKAAADDFVDALTGTPSFMSVFAFGDTSPVGGAIQNLPDLVPLSTAASAQTVKNFYAGWTVPANTATNWDQGLRAAANAGARYDVVVMLTDGNPTAHGDPRVGPRTFNRLSEVEGAIFTANQLKAEGARVLAVGVGAGVQAPTLANLNLAAISGPVRYDGTNTATADYYQEPDYATAATALEALALGSCEGTLTVVKQIVLPGGSITDPDTVVAGPGWQITASGDVPAATQTTTTDETGAVQFPLTGTAGTGLTINVTEAQHSGYTRIPANLAGEPADCMAKTSTGASLPLPAVDFGGGGPGNPGFTITGVPPDGVTTCTIYDQAPVGTTTVVVDKEWVVNGGAPIPHNERPSGLDAQLGLTAPGGGPLDTPEWGHVYSEYTAGTQVSISESSTTVDLPGCSQASVPVVSGPDGVPNPLQPSHEVTLDADPDLNVFTVTNFVTCTTRLTLRKEVAGGGPAAATDWTLSATPQAPGSLPGFSGATGTVGVTGQPVSAEAVYVLAESGGDPRYAQDDIRQSPFVPGTTGSWVCNLLQNANQPGIIDGTDGVVAVPLGSHVVCTATNRVTELGLVKNVTNDNGGTAVPSDWTLTLTPTGNVPAGLEPVTVPGSATPVPILVRPGTTYTVSESGPPAYTLTSLACDPPGILTGPRDVLLGPDIPPEAGATCTVTNDDPAPPPPAPPTLPATGPLTPRLAELGLLLVGLGLACLLAGRRPRPVDAASGS